MPIHYRALDGNTNDATTHIETWETLCRLAGRPDVLYVADCKLCSKATLAHIDKHRGVVRRPNPRRRSGPEGVWKVADAALPSKEG